MDSWEHGHVTTINMIMCGVIDGQWLQLRRNDDSTNSGYRGSTESRQGRRSARVPAAEHGERLVLLLNTSHITNK